MKNEAKIGHNQNPIQEKLEKGLRKIITAIRLMDGAGSDYYRAESTKKNIEIKGESLQTIFHDHGYEKLSIAENVLLTALDTVEDILKDEYEIPYPESTPLGYDAIKEGDITKEDNDH